MKNKTREVRTVTMSELRIARSQEDENKGVIEGYASVFDSWSETLGGIFPFKEKVARGAFTDTIGKDDIRALFNHDPNYVLGRNKADTLELIEDEKGLRVRINPPDTGWARDLQISIERGDINQMSFGFIVEDDEWRSEKGIDIRELKKVRLFDVSPVTFPAYTQTDVGVRGMESYQEYRTSITEAENKLNLEQKEKDKKKVEGIRKRFNIM